MEAVLEIKTITTHSSFQAFDKNMDPSWFVIACSNSATQMYFKYFDVLEIEKSLATIDIP
jgi:hypothetical protein